MSNAALYHSAHAAPLFVHTRAAFLFNKGVQQGHYTDGSFMGIIYLWVSYIERQKSQVHVALVNRYPYTAWRVHHLAGEGLGYCGTVWPNPNAPPAIGPSRDA